MATSALAKQLQSLRGEAVRTKAAGRATLLYHAREAEDVDMETIYGLASNAFVQLCRVDPRFERFSRHLFSDRAREFDREHQTKDANDDIDTQLNAFLRMLTPHFQQPFAHKTLEWLIRRFRCCAAVLARRCVATPLTRFLPRMLATVLCCKHLC
jgi:U3 small nucleolar RNA-associated protein 10